MMTRNRLLSATGGVSDDAAERRGLSTEYPIISRTFHGSIGESSKWNKRAYNFIEQLLSRALRWVAQTLNALTGVVRR
jgi:hypothetical protein